MTYTVQGDGIRVGYHPTPGLALRAFWREIERRMIEGDHPTGYQYLPRRRQYAMQRRFLRSLDLPRNSEQDEASPTPEGSRPSGTTRKSPSS